MTSLIEDYIAGLRRDLQFDPDLAERVVTEIGDHLRDAAESEPLWPSADAERRAIARFGSAREIAAQFATDLVERKAKRTWLVLLATIVVTWLAMRLRVSLIEDTSSTLAPLVDRYAFAAAMGAAAIGWFGFRRSALPLALCLVGLVLSIGAGLIRAEPLVRPMPVAATLPTLMELALLALLFFKVVALGLGLRRTAALRRIAR